MILKNTANQFICFPPLISLSDGSRLTSGAAARVSIDGTWGNAAGTLAVDETDQWKYTPTATETNCDLFAVMVDHASAVRGELFQCRTMQAPVGDYEGVATQASSDQILTELGDLEATLDPDEIVDGVVDGVSDSLAGTVQLVAMSFVSVNTNDIFVLVDSSDGLVSERTKKISRSDSPDYYSVDFRNDCAVNQKVAAITAIEFIEGDSGDVTITAAADWGPNGGTRANFALTPSTVGDYQIRVHANLYPSGTSVGDITFKVV